VGNLYPRKEETRTGLNFTTRGQAHQSQRRGSVRIVTGLVRRRSNLGKKGGGGQNSQFGSDRPLLKLPGVNSTIKAELSSGKERIKK